MPFLHRLRERYSGTVVVSSGLVRVVQGRLTTRVLLSRVMMVIVLGFGVDCVVRVLSS